MRRSAFRHLDANQHRFRSPKWDAPLFADFPQAAGLKAHRPRPTLHQQSDTSKRGCKLNTGEEDGASVGLGSLKGPQARSNRHPGHPPHGAGPRRKDRLTRLPPLADARRVFGGKQLELPHQHSPNLRVRLRKLGLKLAPGRGGLGRLPPAIAAARVSGCCRCAACRAVLRGHRPPAAPDPRRRPARSRRR